MLKSFKKKIFTKALALWVIFLLVFNPFVYTVALSEEITPDPTPSPSPASSITTGDAESQSDTSTIANSNTDNIPGTVTPGSGCNPPDVTPECPVSNNNQADTSSSNTSSAQTGQNSSSDSEGDVSIQTGEATSSAETTNQINTNIVALTGTTDTPEATDSASAENSQPDPLSITNQNEALVQNEATSSAGTGENTASNNQGDVVVNTGDALAVGNMFNLINLNVVGSNFEILVLNLSDQQGDINLFNIWKDLSVSASEGIFIAGSSPENSLSVLVQNSNQASVQNSLQVVALTGQNTADGNGGSVNLQSGGALAVANLTNVVNTNIVGSKLLFVIINVLGSYNGNLILPRREYFESTESAVQSGGGEVINNNEASVSGTVSSVADSGGNQLNGNSNGSSLQTGEAEAVSHNLSFLNFNILGYNWFNFIINHLGSQSGNVWGWLNPESKESPDTNASFSTQSMTDPAAASSRGPNDQQNTSGSLIENSNSASVENHVSAEAISGQNQANGNGLANMVTGTSKALANLFNLINFNISGSNWLFGVLNILGDWNGNTVFAYPDAVTSISGPAGDVNPGDEIDYNVSFNNQGYDDAHGVDLSFELPKGSIFVSDTSGIIPELQGKVLKWSIGDLPAGESGSFSVRVKVDPNLKPDDLLTWWDKLVPVAYAEEEGRREEVTARVSVNTQDPQLDSQNDSSETSTTILFPEANQSENAGGTAMTTIEIKAKNNVNGFVYQGDVITFDLEVKNTGAEIAKSVTVSQDIYDGEPESTGSVDFPLRDIAPGKVVTITFGIQVTDLAPDSYYSVARASGDNISSNEAWTYFDIKPGGISLFSEVIGQEANQYQAGDVNGTQAYSAPVKANKEWWPYVLIAMPPLLWFLKMLRRRQRERWVIVQIKPL